MDYEKMFKGKKELSDFVAFLDEFGDENLSEFKWEMYGWTGDISLDTVRGYYRPDGNISNFDCEVGYNQIGRTYFVKISSKDIYEVSKDLKVISKIAKAHFAKAA